MCIRDRPSITKKEDKVHKSDTVAIAPTPKPEPKVEEKPIKHILPSTIDVLTDRENKLANKV